LVRACLDLGAAKVSAIEKDSECSEALHALLHDRRGDNSLQICDFLDVTPRRAYDRVVMNPPFTRGQDLKHVKHALQFLAHGGALFSVVPDKDCPKFEALGAETVARFEPGAFKSSGTNVATKLIRILRESA
jgi:16S rRNA G1207 methylase RsmC